MSLKKVSVIIPVYNVENYIKECLDTIVNQTFKDIEIICIDDGSTDGSKKIIEEYASKDNRFILVSQENQGQGVARNKGIEIATGEYLTFVDPDDKIELETIEILYNHIEKHNAQVVQCHFKRFDEHLQKYQNIDFNSPIYKNNNFDLYSNEYFTWKDVKKGCLCDIQLSAWGKIYLTDFIKSNHITFSPTKFCEDNRFSLSVLFKAEKIYYIDNVLYTYRLRNSSSFSVKADILLGIFTDIELLKKFLIENNLFEELEDEFKQYTRTLIRKTYNLVPDVSREKFKNLGLEYMTEKEYKKITSKFFGYKFSERIFSVKNERICGVKHKIITIFGIRFKIALKRM